MLNGTGLEFILQQLIEWLVIQAGSRFFTCTESRYAIIENEMMGVMRAIRNVTSFSRVFLFCLINLLKAPVVIWTPNA